jgi:hypothetical protein
MATENIAMIIAQNENDARVFTLLKSIKDGCFSIITGYLDERKPSEERRVTIGEAYLFWRTCNHRHTCQFPAA